MELATLAEVRDYFQMSSGDFTKEWKQLSLEDREWFRAEVGKELGK